MGLTVPTTPTVAPGVEAGVSPGACADDGWEDSETGGGSNGSRVRLWKLELQRLADELGLDIEVHHCPPGTS